MSIQMRLGTYTDRAAATSVSARKMLSTNGPDIIIYNAGPDDAFIIDGGSSSTVSFPTTAVSSAGTPIPAGLITSYKKNKIENQYIAYITEDPTKTADLYFKVGSGE